MSNFSLLYYGGFNPPTLQVGQFPLILTRSGTTATLSWTSQGAAYEYSVYAGANDEPLIPVVTGIRGTTATVEGLQAGRVYAFLVTAQLGDKQVLKSWLARDVGAPVVTAVSGVGTEQLNFAPVPGATGYNVYLGMVSGQESAIPLPQTQVIGGPWAQPNSGGFLVQGLTVGHNYFFLVQPIFNNWLGQCSNEIGVTGVGTVYYGFTSVLNPAASDILGMAGSALTAGFAGAYTLTQSGGPRYPTFAFPVSFGVPNQFVFAGLPYGMVATAVTVNGVPCNVYQNPFQTFSPSMLWTIS